MSFKPFIYITLALTWMLTLPGAYAEDSIINHYDANGNLVSGDGKFYEYNDANQLVRVREKDANGALVAEYSYDHSGQRVKKVESGVITYYLGKFFESKVAQGQAQAQNTSYYFANDDRVAKKDGTGSYFYHPDHLGGISAVTGSTGQVISSTSYLPFGDVRQGGAENYYTGKEKDNASDLYNFDARYVSPELRHFTQADVAEPDFDDPQDLNRYAYVGNNPLSYVDPDGNKKKKAQSTNKKVSSSQKYNKVKKIKNKKTVSKGKTTDKNGNNPLPKWKNKDGKVDDTKSWCTTYVADNYNIPEGMRGNAATWYNNAERLGYETSNTPDYQAIVVFRPSKSYSKYGHVGIVMNIKYNEDGTAIEIEYKDSNGDGNGTKGVIRRTSVNNRDISGYVLTDGEAWH